MNIKEAIKKLSERAALDPDLEITYAGIWTDEDVRAIAKEIGINISAEDARSIVETIEDNFDASCGINWETITYHLCENPEENTL